MDNWAVVDWTKDVWHFVVRMLIAIICGLAIGFERKSRSKEAGIRTHAIVCLASCLFMILSKYLTVPIFSDITGGTFNSDATRIAAQVVTGIGFLGAGIIMYRRDAMRGITTAAGIWATSAIGMAIGAGFVITGITATLIILILQFVFHLPIKAFQTKHLATVKLKVWMETDDVVDKIMTSFINPKVSSFAAKIEDGRTVATVYIVTSGVCTVKELDKIIKENSAHILAIEQVEEV